MKVKLILATIGLAFSVGAKSDPQGWIQRDDCDAVEASHVYNGGIVTLNLTNAGDIWLTFPSTIASEHDRETTLMVTHKVLTMDGIKMKAAAQYHPNLEVVLVLPYTDEGIKVFRSKLQRGGPISIKYNSTTIMANFPPLSDGEKSIANCQEPI